MKKVLNSIWTYLKSIPIYGYIFGVAMPVFQYIMYLIAEVIIKNTGFITRAYIPKLPIDDSIPFVIFFVIFYFLSYIHWGMTFIVSSKAKKDDFFNVVFGYVVAVLIGFVIFSSVPTYMDRTKDIFIQQNINKQGFLYDLWRFLVNNDGGNIALNMCPSFHCMVTTYAFLAVHRENNIKVGFKIYAFLMVLMISLSTVFTKQHYFVDILGGIGLAVFSYSMVILIKPVHKYIEYRNKINIIE